LNDIAAGIDPGNKPGYLSRIRTRYEYMSKSQRMIANYINEHPDEILKHSITTLARKIGTSPSALSRFCQVLHYHGFSDMKFCLEKDLFVPVCDNVMVSGADDISTSKKKFLNLYSSVLKETLLQLDERAIKWAAEAIGKADMTYVYPNGGPGATGIFAYQLFLQIGIPGNCFIDRQTAMMSASHLKKGDVAIGINYAGDASAVCDALSVAKRKGATLIAITVHANSPLAKLADILLTYSAKVEDDLRYRHISMMCELIIIGQIQSAIINLMPQKVQERIRFSKEAIEQTRTKL
jgi:DNA-binding MurR/RpiR family transcriptional regulator